MLSATKSVLNMLFLIFSAAGFSVVFYHDHITSGYAFFLPIAFVAAYGVVVSSALRNCYDRSFADHHIDSIYFLGFLYTLISLVTLFYRLQTELGGIEQAAGAAAEGDAAGLAIAGSAAMSKALYYVGISVSTSLAGVLFRNMVRGTYLKSHPDESDELERTYRLLTSIAEQFASDYRKTFENLELFLSERAETTKEMNETEKRYLESLETFTKTTESFTRALSATEGELSKRVSELGSTMGEYEAGVSRLTEMTGEIADATRRVSSGAGEMPLETTSVELKRFRTGVEELNTVLDSLISILDTKVEKVG
ncbi:MAG: hypothetical protein R6V29_06620 [Spirochaetia bacterium]